MAQEQNDPFAKYVIDEPENDPFEKYVVEQPKIVEDDKSLLRKGWDFATESFLPDLPEREAVTPENLESFPIRAAKEAGRGFYEDIIQPAVSPAGIATSVFGGPLIRGASKLASKVAPGLVEGASAILNKPLFGTGKKAVEEIAPVIAKPKVRANLDGTFSPIDNPKVQLTPTGEVIDGPIDKLSKALSEAKPLTKKQADIYSVERAERFSKARNVPFSTQEESKNFMGQLSGQHTKVQMTPLKLDQPDIDNLYKIVNEKLTSDIIDVPESARAITALGKLLNGAVPQPSEIEVLKRVFGSQLEFPQKMTKRELILRTASLPKALVSGGDFGFPFRQGINYVGRKEWFGMWKPMIESFASEGAKDKWLNAIKTSRNFNAQRRSGLAVYDDISTAREEAVLNSWVQDLPGIKHGNRGYTVAASKLRHDLWNTMYDDYKRLHKSQLKLAGDDKELIRNAELLNPDNLYRQKLMSSSINTGTGRGSIGRLEPIADELNAVLFAPRLMSSRFKTINKTLNPMSYYNGDPVERKDALKQLISITGTALSTASLFKLAGGEVELNPTSTDFLKGRVGKVRFDMMGGYQSYLVPMAKILSGMAKSPTSGKEYELGSGIMPDRFDVLTNFFTNKTSPLGSLFVALMRGREATGKEINLESLSPFENTAMKTLMPIMIQDFKELAEEDPTLLPLMIPGSMGGSIQVHEQRANPGRR